jgi:hypothetical protein
MRPNLSILLTGLFAFTVSACTATTDATDASELTALTGDTGALETLAPVTYEGTVVIDGRPLTVTYRVEVAEPQAVTVVSRSARPQETGGVWCFDEASAPILTHVTVRDGARILFDERREVSLSLINNSVRASCDALKDSLTTVRAGRRPARFVFNGRDVAIGSYVNIAIPNDRFGTLVAETAQPVAFDEALGIASGFVWKPRMPISVAVFRPGDTGPFSSTTLDAALFRQ